MVLASVTRNVISSLDRITENQFWVAANDIEQEGTFVWDHDKLPVDLDIWDRGEPKATTFDFNCAGFEGDTYRLRVYACSSTAMSLCMANACPENYYEVEQLCYWMPHEQGTWQQSKVNLTWVIILGMRITLLPPLNGPTLNGPTLFGHMFQVRCEHHGYVMSYLPSLEYMDIFRQLQLVENFWTGLNDRATEGVFVWDHDNSAATSTLARMMSAANSEGKDCVKFDQDVLRTEECGVVISVLCLTPGEHMP
ncbi:uncharacterized protein LOC131943506 [Physella acuta]|uniref:uncharacterized protein LOC131943506 n=1 Tax=Physella acuta TaxID=109671 RepID=UPI0027DC69D0|nr:uncharacterized protein LOC131943506 [Physella acuta]